MFFDYLCYYITTHGTHINSLLCILCVYIYRIFRTIRRTQKQLIFSKTDSAPYIIIIIIMVIFKCYFSGELIALS